MMCIYSKTFEIVFSFNVKDNNICPCLNNIKTFLSYIKMLQCFANQNAHVYIKQ